MQIDTILADRYQIQSQLSQKAGRQTFLALDIQSQDLVIIKILRFDADFQWDDLKLFEREAATLKNLRHPAIPKYLDYFEVEQPDLRGFALVQTYIEAPSLETVIKQGRKFSQEEVIELADRVLSILTYLHEQNPLVIHRDIKPSNILLANRSGNSTGDVYLVDFGSVQTAASKDSGTITIVGSYGYIPLEQFGGQTTFASDLYSLGMTLIYLLTGTHPSELKQINGQIKFTAEISSKFKRWLERMTQPHLDKRFDSAKIAQTALHSEDGSYGDFDRLKPTNTQIQLYRDRDKLEIIWPETSKIFIIFQFIALVLGFCIWSLISMTLWVFSMLLLSYVSSAPLFLFVSSLIFLFGFAKIGSLIALIFNWILQRIKLILKVNYHLNIDDRYICKLRSRGQKSQTVKLSEHPRSQVEILAYNPGYTFDKCVDTNGNLMGGAICIQPKLHLYCGDFEYFFPNQFSQGDVEFPHQFSQAELWWLGNELSDFLNLELQVIYPTPKVPPVPS